MQQTFTQPRKYHVEVLDNGKWVVAYRTDKKGLADVYLRGLDPKWQGRIVRN